MITYVYKEDVLGHINKCDALAVHHFFSEIFLTEIFTPCLNKAP